MKVISAEVVLQYGNPTLFVRVQGKGREVELTFPAEQKFLFRPPGNVVVFGAPPDYERRHKITISPKDTGTGVALVLQGATDSPGVVDLVRAFVRRAHDGTLVPGPFKG